jgi:hypothetical protein
VSVHDYLSQFVIMSFETNLSRSGLAHNSDIVDVIPADSRQTKKSRAPIFGER